MRVIYRGELPSEKWYKATCTHCKSVMEFQRKEVHWSHNQHDGDSVSFTCPVCQKTTTSDPKITTPATVKGPDYR